VPPKEFIPVEEEPEEEEEETPPVEAESETEPTFYSVFELTKQPRVTIPPEVANRYYPPLAKKAKLEGKVLLECIITAEGKIEEIKIVKKAGFGFEEAAIEMLKDPRVRVTPGELEGKPVAVKVHLPVKFTLSEN
jgi:protein TonB